jgi:hypothetical protein
MRDGRGLPVDRFFYRMKLGCNRLRDLRACVRTSVESTGGERLQRSLALLHYRIQCAVL